MAAYGEPEFAEPAHRSAPAMLVYGDMEFRLRGDALTALPVKFDRTRPSPARRHRRDRFLTGDPTEMARVAVTADYSGRGV